MPKLQLYKTNKLIIVPYLFIVVFGAFLADMVQANKHDHVQTAALVYSSTNVNNASFLARKIDLLINPTNDLYDRARNVDTNFTALDYTTFSSFIFGSDTLWLADFCNQRGYDDSTFYMWADEDTIILISQGVTCVTPPGEKITMSSWGHYRYVLDGRNEHLGEWIWYNIVRDIGTHGSRNYRGVMEDEAFLLKHSLYGQTAAMLTFPFHTNMWVKGTPSDAEGWDDYNSISISEFAEIQDSLIYLKHEAFDWASELSDSLEANNYLFFRNPANYMCWHDWPAPATYGNPPPDYETEGYKGLGSLLGEYVWLRPTGGATLGTQLQYLRMMSDYADSGTTSIMWVYIIPSDSVALGSWRRCQYERLCYYYMAADPQKTWFMITRNEGLFHPNAWQQLSDTLWRYTPLLEVNIGQPIADSGYYSIQSGTDGSGQSYTIRSRDFSNAKVLWRFQNGSNYGNSSAVTLDLDQDYYLADENGNVSANPVSQVSIRNADGLILLKSLDSIIVPIDTIPPDSIDDLGQTNPGPDPDTQTLASAGPHFYPNPFDMTYTPTTTFTGIKDEATLVLMTPTGDIIKSWDNIMGEDINWNGTNSNGSEVASNVYLWYLTGTDYKGKLVVVN